MHESGMMQSSSLVRLLACVVDSRKQDPVVSAACIRVPEASPTTPHALAQAHGHTGARRSSAVLKYVMRQRACETSITVCV